jgi:DNA (cytosine-5)-methyltransferase 1
MMKVAGLFAGVGGIEIGLEKAGHDATLLCEVDPAAQDVLRRRFPGVRLVPDVRELERLPKSVDLLTAGFPCQDLSQVGTTRGIRGRKSGLVRHVFRLVEADRPQWVLLENVPFLLNLQKGRGMAYVVRELQRLGYSWAYRVIDTRAFGIPQRRERLFILASLNDDPSRVLFTGDKPKQNEVSGRKIAHGFYWTEGNRGLGWAVDSIPTLKGGSTLGIPSPPAIWFPDGQFGTPDIRDAERLQGFPAGWTKAAELHSRPSHRWTLVGNAVSVPVARWIGQMLNGYATGDTPTGEVLLARAPWPKAAFGGPRVPRHAVDASTWPVPPKTNHLHEFLRYEAKPLSQRAAEGFKNRLFNSSLRRPVEFDRALEKYARSF